MRKNQIIFIIAAIAVVTLGIYVMFGKSGNMMVAENGGNHNEAQVCSAAVEQAKVLDKAIGGEIAGFTLLDEAHYVGDLSFKDRDGKVVTIAEWTGRTMLLNLWATWCVPCRREMPALEALEKTKGGDAFQVVPVSIDTGEAAKPLAFYDEINLEALPFYADNTMKMFNQFKKKSLAFGLPTSLLINKNSCVVGALFGPAEWASDDAFKLIDAAIAM
ncbi:MAG: TlpA disulfide reductase family protein [Rhizobiaceae bacterium]